VEISRGMYGQWALGCDIDKYSETPGNVAYHDENL